MNLGTDPTLNFALAALEGIVARTQPSIFLIEGSEDNSWLNYTVQKYGLCYTYVKSSAKDSVLEAFQSYVTNAQGKVKVVLYDANDPLFPTQLEMAITLSGVQDALPVSTTELPALQGIFGANNITVVDNLVGNFTDKVSAYTWLWNTVQNSVTKRFVGLAPSGVLGLTDYLVENKAFVFEFS
ncbi:MAG TPA: GxGYxYP domain-containing protein, partial [Nitrososphaerales archaeon]|nr:GxGYxYP domain-containing protein [Nitrososphaerales archaeon]